MIYSPFFHDNLLLNLGQKKPLIPSKNQWFYGIQPVFLIITKQLNRGYKMPVMKLYNNGLTSGNPPMKNDHKRGLRGVTDGWTNSASRSNTRFLYSVVSDELGEDGFAFTFTVKDLPPTPADWEKLRQKMVKRLRRIGFIRLHWLTEWQRRGVPHLHGVVYFDHHISCQEWSDITEHWLQAAKQYNPSPVAQDCKPVNSAIGWLEYLSKHAARGVYHYQRNGKPDSWLKTGRMWGKSGEWPTRMTETDLTMIEFWKLRRLCRNWRLADARTPKKYTRKDNTVGYRDISVKRIVSARKCLKHRDRGLCAVLGVSEWINQDIALKMLDYIKSTNET